MTISVTRRPYDIWRVIEETASHGPEAAKEPGDGDHESAAGVVDVRVIVERIYDGVVLVDGDEQHRHDGSSTETGADSLTDCAEAMEARHQHGVHQHQRQQQPAGQQVRHQQVDYEPEEKIYIYNCEVVYTNDFLTQIKILK